LGVEEIYFAYSSPLHMGPSPSEILAKALTSNNSLVVSAPEDRSLNLNRSNDPRLENHYKTNNKRYSPGPVEAVLEDVNPPPDHKISGRSTEIARNREDSDNPRAFWYAWTKRHQECIIGSKSKGERKNVSCDCFEGLGSVM